MFSAEEIQTNIVSSFNITKAWSQGHLSVDSGTSSARTHQVVRVKRGKGRLNEQGWHQEHSSSKPPHTHTYRLGHVVLDLPDDPQCPMQRKLHAMRKSLISWLKTLCSFHKVWRHSQRYNLHMNFILLCLFNPLEWFIVTDLVWKKPYHSIQTHSLEELKTINHQTTTHPVCTTEQFQWEKELQVGQCAAYSNYIMDLKMVMVVTSLWNAVVEAYLHQQTTSCTYNLE